MSTWQRHAVMDPGLTIRERALYAAEIAGLITQTAAGYRATELGRDTLARIAPGHWLVPLAGLLSTIAEDDDLGGSSLEVFVRDLGEASGAVASVGFAALNAGLLDYVRVDRDGGGDAFRLNHDGWAVYGCSLISG